MSNSGLTLTDFSMTVQPEWSEEEVIRHLTDRISEMLTRQPDLLFSTLYRLDISELKIKKVMSDPGAVSVERGLAVLVLERQKQRLQSKRKYKSDGDFAFE